MAGNESVSFTPLKRGARRRCGDLIRRRFKTQRRGQNAILVNIGHILQLQHPSKSHLIDPEQEALGRGVAACKKLRFHFLPRHSPLPSVACPHRSMDKPDMCALW